MIAKLTGRLDSLGEDWAVIDVGGVGYLVYCPARVLGRLPAPGGMVSLVIETHVREDHIHLYGFLTLLEREWFRVLSTVQGVGTKAALALLSVLSPEALTRAILADDRAALTRAAGVGPKLAGRLLAELKDRAALVGVGITAAIRPAAPPEGGTAPPAADPPAPQTTGGPAHPGTGAPPPPAAAAAGGDDLIADAVSALVNLGYGRSEAFAAVTSVLPTGQWDSSSAPAAEGPSAEPALLVAAALRSLGREVR